MYKKPTKIFDLVFFQLGNKKMKFFEMPKVRKRKNQL